MPDCTFCQESLAKGKGIMFIKRDGKALYFCSSKCRKNSLGLKREGRKKKWTKSYSIFRASQGKNKK